MADKTQADDKKFSKETKFFRSTISGLAVQVGDAPAPGEQHQTVRFQPRKFFDKRIKEHYVEGYLATDNAEALEKLAADVNVEEIKESEYNTAIENSEPSAL